MKAKKNETIFNAYLLQNENILWMGKPSPWSLLSSSDVFLIPFSLMWGGFAIFWMMAASGAGGFSLFGLPFVLIGQYFIWGRFVHAHLRRKQTIYAISNHRVLILKTLGGQQLESYPLSQIPAIIWRGKNIYLGETPTLFSASRSNGMAVWSSDTLPGLYGLYDVEDVYQLLQELTISTDNVDSYPANKRLGSQF
ncbi:MAG: hypothetical protein Phog2KO_26650 [Phototrophicaceae bacterium]